MSQVRHQKLLEIVQSLGYASVELLANELSCSQPTIRRDIKKLCNDNQLQRFHGGVSQLNSTVRLGYQSKSFLMSEEKALIAQYVITKTQNSKSLFLDAGTTCDKVASFIGQHPPLTLITHNISAALTIAKQELNHSVIVVGGVIRGADGSIVGAKTVQEINSYHADCTIICASGLDSFGNVLDFDMEKVEVKKAMMRASSRKILLLDSSKFKKRGVVHVCHLSDFDLCITDKQPSEDYLDLFNKSNTLLDVAAS